MAKKNPKTAKPVVMTQARLLVDTWIGGTLYPCDTLIEAEDKLVAGLVKSGQADSNPDAVAYKRDEGATVIVIPADEIAADAVDDASTDDDDKDQSKTGDDTGPKTQD